MLSSSGIPALLAVLALLFVSAVATAQTETVLYSFTGGADGNGPGGNLVMDPAGDLFGISQFSGDTHCQCGAVFELTSAGILNVLHDFTGAPTDGSTPESGLVMAGPGTFYGTTFLGGAQGQGTVYRVTSTGTESVVHNFHNSATGNHPAAALVRDAATGNFYGTTANGGVSNSNCFNGCGTAFSLAPNGTETLLYEFAGLPTDGDAPVNAMIADAAGNLYGTTIAGGPTNNGVVFKLTPAGVETVLYSFTDSADGGTPQGSLLLDAQGNLYGTTARGGTFNTTCPSGCGVVYKVTPAGKETVLYSFQGLPDGNQPLAGLVRDSARNLYGTTAFGGVPTSDFATGGGTVFKISPTGTETALYSFTGGADGGNPEGPLLLKSGTLYGSTEFGGDTDNGTIFKLTP
jgi:uncharacterized repeat protein (TIGR03803 family)